MFKIKTIRLGIVALPAISGALLIESCKGGTPRKPVSVRVVFYNHAQGLLGEKTYDGISGETFTIMIAGLGHAGIDSKRIAVRKGADREAMGELLQFSKSGAATLSYPDSNATWEAHLMNIGLDGRPVILKD